jgi:hypothetical protein
MSATDYHLTTLFNTLVAFRQECTQLDKEAEGLSEIAMNAAVTAGQTGKSIRIYTEISRQIAHSSKKMQILIDKNRFEVNQILNFTLKVLSQSNLNENYVRAEEKIKEAINLHFIKQKTASLQSQWKKNIRTIQSHLFPSKSLLRSLLQLQYRLFGAYNCLLIESIHLEGTQYSAIKALSENLLHSYERSILCLERLFSMLKKITRLIQILNT